MIDAFGVWRLAFGVRRSAFGENGIRLEGTMAPRTN